MCHDFADVGIDIIRPPVRRGDRHLENRDSGGGFTPGGARLPGDKRSFDTPVPNADIQ